MSSRRQKLSVITSDLVSGKNEWLLISKFRPPTMGISTNTHSKQSSKSY
jgi:hypothetical protein